MTSPPPGAPLPECGFHRDGDGEGGGQSAPLVVRRGDHSISRKQFSPNVLRVLYQLRHEGFAAYIAGGALRDLLLGHTPKDFDVATDARPGQIKKIFRNSRLIGRRFRLAHVHFGDEVIEVATFRRKAGDEDGADSPESGGRAFRDMAALRPKAVSRDPYAWVPAKRREPDRPPLSAHPLDGHEVAEDGRVLRDNLYGTPEQDAKRRDFTINALYYNIDDFTLVDYVGAIDDLQEGVIRTIGDPVASLMEDPVRMVRAVRFAAKLGFRLDPALSDAVREHRARIATASSDRMFDEISKLFLLGKAEQTYLLLADLGLFHVLFPIWPEGLDAASTHPEAARMRRVMEWVDARHNEDDPVSVPLLYALMFGSLVTHQAECLKNLGAHHAESVVQAVSDFVVDLETVVRLPKRHSMRIRDILGSQHRFFRVQGKRPVAFSALMEFSESFDYFQFQSEWTGENREFVLWWKHALGSGLDEARFLPAPPMPDGLQVPVSRSRKRGKRRR